MAELFDSTNGTFTITGPMTKPRQWHTATTLASGAVLIIGGDLLVTIVRGNTGIAFFPESTATTEFFDPGSKTFMAGSNLLQERAKHTATLLKDGSILVAGGRLARIMGTITLSFVRPEAEVFMKIGT